ncbi:MAG: helix-hairpin-helix domain-containing protein [Ferruginibacter sp.]|nr:helix-hairpin-helix domain-containing protein [Ferruginibacter sp.]
MKNFIKSYFDFSKQERRGILTLFLLIIAVSFLPKVFPYFIKPKVQNTDAFEKDIARLVLKQQDSSRNFYSNNYDDDNNFQNYHQPNYKNYVIKGELFYFDPNTISAAEWKRLGVRDKTIATIQNYLSKGGKFYKPEDITKIWGFFPNEVDRLLPYVQIVPNGNYKTNNYYNNYENKTYDKPKYTPKIVDINMADTSAYIELPGIGSKLANRIVNYRDKLGGFYKVEQIKETFGLADSTFQKIKDRLVLNTKAVTQININTATIEELKVHPYLKQNLAKVILNYRTQHGNYQSINDLKKIMIIDEEVFAKISPYLTTQ